MQKTSLKKTIKFILLSLCVFSVIGQVSFVHADGEVEQAEEVEVEDTQGGYIEVEAEVGTQRPLSKKVPIKVKYTPKVQGRKGYVKIHTPTVIEENVDKKWVDISKGAEHIETFYVKAVEAGVHNVTAEVIIYGYDVNYGDSDSVQLVFNESYILKSSAQAYYLYIALFIVIGIIFLVLFVLFMLKFGKKIFKRFLAWLLNDSKYQALDNTQEIKDFYQDLSGSSSNSSKE